MIYTFIPYALNKDNFGNSCNDYFKLLGDDDWGAYLTYDQMFLTPHWLQQLYTAIENNPEVGMFTCYTNRIGSAFQKIGADENNHSVRYHREFAEKIRKDKGDAVKILPPEPPISGHFVLLKKSIWQEVGGFSNGFLSVDNDMHRKVVRKGYKVGLIEGLYVYHWYRAYD